jgi:hypothetical protein
VIQKREKLADLIKNDISLKYWKTHPDLYSK